MANATGGTITYSGGKTIHTFTSNDTFVMPPGVTANVELLIVAGGGGGGAFGGGGGAGGVVYDAAYPVFGSNSVVVGNGGAGQATYNSGNPGANGQNSVFHARIAYGGGGGGTRLCGSPCYGLPGVDGGSGGGASPSDGGAVGAPGNGVSGQGNNGGEGGRYSWGGGGGGGAGGAGGNSTEPNACVAGNGGAGVAYSISGTSTYYASGGGGCNHTGGTVGSASAGGGTAGKITATASNAAANTGGGGGGGGAGAYAGGNGGSGIVIVSYTTGSLISKTTNYLSKVCRRCRIPGNLTGRLFPIDGLTNYWDFESDATDLVSSNNGTESSITHSAGLIGNGAVYNAATDYISITPITGSTITIAGWYYYGTANAGSWNTLFCRNLGSYHHVLINGTSKIIGFYNGAFYPSTLTMVTGNWYFIICEKVGTNEKIYVNNGLYLDSNSSFDNNSYPFGIIGNYSSATNTQGCIGTIDEVGVWNRVLTADEKTYLYNKGNGVSFYS